MDSSDKTFLAAAVLVVIIVLALLGAGMYSQMLRHSCNLHGFQAQYDSAHVAQICGK